VLTIAADLAQADHVQHVIDGTLERFGRCDVLVNNAAVSFVGNFVDVPSRRWRTVMEVNLIAPVALTQGFLPGMLERGVGHIVNMSSEAADPREHSEVAQLAYASSKAALDTFSFGLAGELAGTGVAVNILAPEVLTEAVTFSVKDPDVLEVLARQMVAPAPYGRAVAWVAAQPSAFTGNYLTNRSLVELGALVLE
jgi:NAD(P)-dependent dehydrogenase (short-subunit alcohol dehydrogenase family)